uniref:Gibberellin 20 oxidase 1 n=1 Tax=Talaromyces marneffei PM1 TaxID=1077442 RepID=A0A093Y301_TALMA
MASYHQNNSAVSAGVQQDDLTIPLIDFSSFLSGDPKTKQATASAILHAFRTSGFLYLSNAGITPSTVQNIFAHSARFFDRPEPQKEALSWDTPESNRGYVTFGREKVTQSADPEEILRLRAANPDYKETMEIGREGVEGLPNKWPDCFDAEGRDFTSVMRAFHDTCKELHMQVMRAIALGMGYEETFFDEYTDVGDNTLRLLHYPPVLKSDDIGGLEVKSPQNTWVRAVPIKNTIVVNAGDLLARWSNDTIKSTNHRVVQPPAASGSSTEGSGLYPTRYSVAYFCNPNFDKTIEALPGTYGNVSEKKYEPIKSGDYLTMRLAATY